MPRDGNGTPGIVATAACGAVTPSSTVSGRNISVGVKRRPQRRAIARCGRLAVRLPVRKVDQQMDFVVLGSSSGTPTLTRNVSGSALRFDDGRVWLIDCGEGTQHRILRSPLRPGRIERILLTHLHGDHSYGLPGLLASLGVHNRSAAVEVIGPPGVREWLKVTRQVSDLRLGYRLRVTEVQPGDSFERDGVGITVRPMRHRVPSYAYLLREPTQRGRVDIERVRALGLAPGPELGRLADGESLRLQDGREIRPEDVLGPARPGRLLVHCGDSSDSSALLGEAEDCDLLVHECTHDAGRRDRAIQWGHSTTEMVAELATALRPRLLVLTHFSSRYTCEGGAMTVADLLEEFRSRCPDVPVMAADDLLSVPIPPRG